MNESDVSPMTRQIITTPNGDRLVVLPEAEYEALIDRAEDAADRAAVEAFVGGRDGDPDTMVDSAVMRRLLDPKQAKVRVWREVRGLTGAALAQRAGLSAAYVSQIETGAREPGARALKALAQALNVDLDDLV